MRVLVCGGRDYNDRGRLYAVLSTLLPPASLIIAGGARGADSLAVDWARECHVAYIVFAADWKRHGKAAGPIRNQQMLDEGKPERVVAFPGGRGTADMIRRSHAAGLPVTVID